MNTPEILPKLLLSVKWNSRDEVAQVTYSTELVLSFEEALKYAVLRKLLEVKNMLCVHDMLNENLDDSSCHYH